MAKKKVWELARETSIPLQELLDILPVLGLAKASHLDILDEEDEEKIHAYLKDKSKRGAERKTVARNVVRRRARRTDVEGVADAVPETVPEGLAVMPDPASEPEVDGAPEPALEEQAAPETAAETGADTQDEGNEALAVVPDPAVAAATPEIAPEPVAATPAEAAPTPAPVPVEPPPPLETDEQRKQRQLLELEEREKAEEEDRKKRSSQRQKRGRRIVVERKQRGALKRQLLATNGDDESAARMPVVEERASGRRQRRQLQRDGSPLPQKAEKRVIRVKEDVITVADLAHGMSVKATQVIKKLIDMGVMAGVNEGLDLDTSTLVAEEFDYKIERIAAAEEKYTIDLDDTEDELVARPPVITIMGHVDHGKTSLLDAIQTTDLAAAEAGGITQAVGAYRVDIDRGTLIFIDTPGHEAFTAMRARGAAVTDMVILVVAADDGAQPQTIEAINHARAAGVPIVVAVNKIDKDNADLDRVRRELSEHDLLCEEWGGDIVFVNISAKLKQNIDSLLDMVLLQAEMLELEANPDAGASGFVIESRLDKQTGPTCTVIVKRGTMRVGDLVVAGSAYGRVRSMVDEHGKPVEAVRPSFFAEITGLNDTPKAGDRFFVTETEREARDIADVRRGDQRKAETKIMSRPTLETLFAGLESGDTKELKLILKADVQGSVEAIRGALGKLPDNKVEIKLIHSAVGGITAGDVQLAVASDAIVVGFGVRAENAATSLASDEGIEIKTYRVIYDLLDDIRAAMEGLLDPRIEEEVVGQVEVRQVFVIPKVGAIAGCYVTSGKVVRNAKARIYRDNVLVYEGRISSLKRHKDDAKEVAQGYECGLGVDNFNDIKVGDLLEVIEEKKVKETL